MLEKLCENDDGCKIAAESCKQFMAYFGNGNHEIQEKQITLDINTLNNDQIAHFFDSYEYNPKNRERKPTTSLNSLISAFEYNIDEIKSMKKNRIIDTSNSNNHSNPSLETYYRPQACAGWGIELKSDSGKKGEIEDIVEGGFASAIGLKKGEKIVFDEDIKIVDLVHKLRSGDLKNIKSIVNYHITD